jgi:hypothetical protein
MGVIFSSALLLLSILDASSRSKPGLHGGAATFEVFIAKPWATWGQKI